MLRKKGKIMQNNYHKEFKDELLDNEKILWSGKPKDGVFFKASDALMIPFSLMWGGFAIFWEMSVITTDAPIFFKLWGIPFVLVGLYIIFGRFLFEKKERGKTFYAVTDSRVLIKSGLFNTKLTSLSLQKLPELSITKKDNGFGTIEFGDSNILSSIGSFTPYKKDNTPKFEMIEDVQYIYNEIIRLQREKS